MSLTDSRSSDHGRMCCWEDGNGGESFERCQIRTLAAIFSALRMLFSSSANSVVQASLFRHFQQQGSVAWSGRLPGESVDLKWRLKIFQHFWHSRDVIRPCRAACSMVDAGCHTTMAPLMTSPDQPVLSAPSPLEWRAQYGRGCRGSVLRAHGDVVQPHQQPNPLSYGPA